MLTPEKALQKIKQLSSEKQKQVFQLIETFEKQREETEDFICDRGYLGKPRNNRQNFKKQSVG